MDTLPLCDVSKCVKFTSYRGLGRRRLQAAGGLSCPCNQSLHLERGSGSSISQQHCPSSAASIPAGQANTHIPTHIYPHQPHAREEISHQDLVTNTHSSATAAAVLDPTWNQSSYRKRRFKEALIVKG